MRELADASRSTQAHMISAAKKNSTQSQLLLKSKGLLEDDNDLTVWPRLLQMMSFFDFKATITSAVLPF
eukprot:m.819358 g.819358  ORF g.819358 m.819358 type:complete len:69 (-) comp59390_c1_seq8:248-454(-)